MKHFIFATSILTLVACSSHESTADLNGTNFTTTQNGTEITLSFDENQASGKIVNLYHGSYKINGNKIQFSPFATTMMMGPIESMDVEQEYFKFMSGDSITYEYIEHQLILQDNTGNKYIFNQTTATDSEHPDTNQE